MQHSCIDSVLGTGRPSWISNHVSQKGIDSYHLWYGIAKQESRLTLTDVLCLLRPHLLKFMLASSMSYLVKVPVRLGSSIVVAHAQHLHLAHTSAGKLEHIHTSSAKSLFALCAARLPFNRDTVHTIHALPATAHCMSAHAFSLQCELRGLTEVAAMTAGRVRRACLHGFANFNTMLAKSKVHYSVIE